MKKFNSSSVFQHFTYSCILWCYSKNVLSLAYTYINQSKCTSLCNKWLQHRIAPWALKPNLLQWGVLGQKLMLNLCRRPRLWLKLLLLTFWKFGLWPCDLLAFGLCDLAEILPLEMGVNKKAAYQISSKSVKKWPSYYSIQVLALAFY